VISTQSKFKTLLFYYDKGMVYIKMLVTAPEPDHVVALFCDHGNTSCFSFTTNDPTPTRCVAFAGIVSAESGIQYTSIKYFGSAW